MFTRPTARASLVIIALLAGCSAPAEPPFAESDESVANSHLVYDCTSQSSVPETECDALVAFYNSTNGDAWSRNTGWLTDPDPCEWLGVGCEGGSVTGLGLVLNGMSGTLPPELADLTNLSRLELYINQIGGSIPSELGDLASLSELDLNHNELSGSIPSELGSLASLERMDLRYNQLTGSIPSELGDLTALQYLNLGNNQLSGSIPPELGNLTSLERLHLFDNELSGSIPPELGNLGLLEFAELFGNQLSGSLPPELGNLSSLVELELSHNPISGSIPSEFGNLASLENLLITDTQLSGPIPPELGSLTGLKLLLLENNLLYGQVPLVVAQIGGALFDPTYGSCHLDGNAGLFMPDTEPYRAADVDADGLICRVALGADTDGDGIPDALDPDVLADVVATFPDVAFHSGGNRNALTARLENIEADIAAGDTVLAIEKLMNLRARVDGCGATADTNDWIVDCPSQLIVRDLIDTLITGLGG